MIILRCNKGCKNCSGEIIIDKDSITLNMTGYLVLPKDCPMRLKDPKESELVR